MKDQPKPITEEHKAFALAMVALAREHGASMLVVEFDLASSRRFRSDSYNPTRVRLAWGEGRHGDNGPVNLRAEAHETLSELDSARGAS